MTTPIKQKRKKLCPKCGQKKWKRDFYRFTPGEYCKECNKTYKREQYRKNHKVPDGKFYHPAYDRIVEHKGCSTSIAWSENMLSLMRRHFATTTNDDMADMLGVSPRTVVRKARQMGLDKDKDWLLAVWNERRLMAQAESARKGHPGTFKKGNQIGKEYCFKPKEQRAAEAQTT